MKKTITVISILIAIASLIMSFIFYTQWIELKNVVVEQSEIIELRDEKIDRLEKHIKWLETKDDDISDWFD